MFPLQWEEDELREFELLEEAAAELSLLSKTDTSTHHTPPTPQAPNALQWFPPTHKQTSTQQNTPSIENVDIESSLPFTVRYEGESPTGKSDDELDDTLIATPPHTSLAAGIDFNDEESWDSFSKPSPERQPLNPSSNEVHSSMESLTAKPPIASDSSESEVNEFAISRRPFANRLISTAPTISDSMSKKVFSHPSSHPETSVSVTSVLSGNTSDRPIPPPSHLISKLFPALRKETVKPAPQLTKAPSPAHSVDSDSGKDSSLSSATSLLGEELRLKLAQLETEIGRYRTENGRLEALRREREEVSVCLRLFLMCV